ncbi:MAG: hypothetical protein FP833_05495 [Atribacteria sp.]|nr:hypothetical protein [Candidatus Atribacteria bacterium]MBU4289394.1 hypothetical protein [Pseudomonadota bacterium]
MSTENIFVTIIASVISGIASVIISTIFYIRHEKRKDKLETLRRFMGNRYDLVGDEFSRAINEVFVVFKKSPKVMKALSEYHQKVTERQSSEDELIKLFKAMCDDVSLPYSEFNDSFFLRPFNTRTTSTITKQ